MNNYKSKEKKENSNYCLQLKNKQRFNAGLLTVIWSSKN